ncbi:hypothetical protein Mgra_00003455 [Meloidogyne graminicola]|uniref:Uncharacterized protein n=1 Tax=Meloidogyne graminicola TaxID=189291 RepID=A0A8S9ZV68_9BILA|nr:hypothetical protein Mgra_00003455 [Meloidogyne graminicola]
MHNENKIELLDNNETSSIELNENLKGNKNVEKTTTELTNVEGYIIDDKENKGSNDSNNGDNEINKMEQVMPPEVSNKAGFVQEAMSAFIGKMEDDKTITTGKVQTRHDEFKKMAEFVLKNNLSESDVIDPWKDDIKSLGLTVNSSAILNETNSDEEEWENNNTKAKLNELNINETLNNKSKNVDNISNNQVNVIHIRLHIKPEETFAERRARYCSNSLAHIMPKLRNHVPPFFVFNLSCISYNQGNENNNYCFPSKNANLYNPSLTENVWKNSEHCLDGIWKIVNSSTECLMVTGFVDSILDFSKISNLMIAKIEEEKAVENEKSIPVIRLFCNNDAITFYNALNDFEKGPLGYLDADGNVRTNEELVNSSLI